MGQRGNGHAAHARSGGSAFVSLVSPGRLGADGRKRAGAAGSLPAASEVDGEVVAEQRWVEAVQPRVWQLLLQRLLLAATSGLMATAALFGEPRQ
jgi:hypothetical protein